MGRHDVYAQLTLWRQMAGGGTADDIVPLRSFDAVSNGTKHDANFELALDVLCGFLVSTPFWTETKIRDQEALIRACARRF